MGKVNRPQISIVVPFYNEEACIESVCRECHEVFSETLDMPWEFIIVNDGSSDRTLELANRLHGEYREFRVLTLMPNSGQSAALTAGFKAARGDLIATLDGDGQNDPGDLTALLREMDRRKVHMMCGVRVRRADNWIRKISSRIANRIRSTVLNDNVSDVGCSLRVFRRTCLDRVVLFRNFHRFFPALFIMQGFTVSEMPVNHRPRREGESKYGGGIRSRLWVGLADLAGVFWLSRRSMCFEVTEQSGNGQSIE